MNRYNLEWEVINHNTKDITWGKHQPKTPSLYYQSSGNPQQHTKRIILKSILLPLYFDDLDHRLPRPQYIGHKSSNPLFPCAILIGVQLQNICELAPIIPAINHRSNYAILEDTSSSCMQGIFHGKIQESDSTLSLIWSQLGLWQNWHATVIHEWILSYLK